MLSSAIMLAKPRIGQIDDDGIARRSVLAQVSYRSGAETRSRIAGIFIRRSPASLGQSETVADRSGPTPPHVPSDEILSGTRYSSLASLKPTLNERLQHQQLLPLLLRKLRLLRRRRRRRNSRRSRAHVLGIFRRHDRVDDLRWCFSL